MFKKGLMIVSLSALSSSLAFAYNFSYVGGGVGWQTAGQYNGLIGNAYTGYGMTVGEKEIYYIGGEVFTSALSIPLSNYLSKRITYAFGASFIPGLYMKPDMLIYARLGIEATHVHGTNNTETGTQLGLGLQFFLTKCWDIRAEYAYTSTGFVENFGSTRSNQFNFGVVYKLG